MSDELRPCPFCGGAATIEEISSGDDVKFSPGCAANEADCVGYQVLQTFARRHDAVTAWNRRSPDPVGELVEALHWYADKANYDADGRCVVYDRNADRTLPDRGCRARSALAKHAADARPALPASGGEHG